MKILIIQLRRIGDVIVTIPVISALRKSFPKAKIDFLVEKAPAPILENHPDLNSCFVFDKKDFWLWIKKIRNQRYDMVFDFMNNPRTAQITLLSASPVRAGFIVPFWSYVYNRKLQRPQVPTYGVQSKLDLLRSVGVNYSKKGVLPRVYLTESDFDGAKGWWRESGLDRYSEVVGLAATHRHEIRRWPASKFLEVIKVLWKKKDRAFILFGGPGEESYLDELKDQFPERVFRNPPGPLRQAASLLSRCHVVVTNDSGLMHLSVAVGTPTVTIYGPTWPQSWNPQVPPHEWVQAEGLSCVGCNLDQCPYKNECMDWIPASKVIEKVEKVLVHQLSQAIT